MFPNNAKVIKTAVRKRAFIKSIHPHRSRDRLAEYLLLAYTTRYGVVSSSCGHVTDAGGHVWP